jgi:2'-5' RNA ligase
MVIMMMCPARMCSVRHQELLPVLLSSSLSNSHRHHQRWATMSRSWDPLTPRRSRASLTAVGAHDERFGQNQEGRAKHEQESSRGINHPPAGATTKVRPRNRPGFNSYLKVDMPDKVLRNLRQMIVQTVASNYASNKRSCRIKPRSLESLHMTLFFGGKTLGQVGKGQLEDLHRRFTSVIQGSGFVATRAANSTRPTRRGHDSSSTAAAHSRMPCHPGDNFWFIIKEVRVFPPGRNNLIVAILEAAPAWHTLHNNLREAARAVESDEIRTVLSYSHETFVAHITLATIISPKGPNKQSLQRLQQKLCDAHLALPDNQRRVVAKGISMGGPMPTQVDLNWNFPFGGK